MKQQKALIVTDETHRLNILNTLLADHWMVVNTCPMPSSCVIPPSDSRMIINPTCLVIVEKEV